MSQIVIHSAYGVLEAKPMVLADIEHDSVPESEFGKAAETDSEESE